MPRAADMLAYRTPQQFGAGQTIDRSVPMATPTGEYIPPPPTESQMQWEGALSNPSIANILYGAGEAAMSVLTSPAPYLAGMVGYGYGALTGKDPKATGAQFEQAATIQPQTALGQYYTEQVGDKLSALPPVVSGIPTPRLGAGAARYAGQQYGTPLLEKSLTMYEQGKLTPGFTPISQLEAWHGTPHEIKGGFDISKVGTGEGAQAYGHGMYFAEAKDLGTTYRRKLTDEAGNPVTDPNKSIQLQIGRLEDQIKQLKQSNDPSAASMIKAYQSRINEIDKAGNLYKVDIPDAAIPMMLNWDVPLNQQPNILENIKRLSAREDLPKGFSQAIENALQSKYFDGQDLYYELTKVYKNPSDLSKAMQESGFTGIRYLDAQSRGAKEGSSNYVVFDPSKVKILEKNDKPIDVFSILYK